MLAKEQNFYTMRGNCICSTMAWERRNNNHFYYRKVRKGSKVSSVYIGKDIPSYNLSGKAHKQKLLNQKLTAQTADEEAVDQTIEANHKAIIALAEAALLLKGYHLHKGLWRKINGKRNQ